MGAVKALRVDHYTPKGLFFSAVLFFLFFILVSLVGLGGPQVAERNTVYTGAEPCPATGECTVTASVQLTGLTAWKQAAWITAEFARPRMLDGSAALPNQALRFDVVWQSDATGYSEQWGNAVLSNNATLRTATIFCPPVPRKADGSLPTGAEIPPCSRMFLFGQPFMWYQTVDLRVTLQQPLGPFDAVAGLDRTVRWSVLQGNVTEKYTAFEVGFKVFFCVMTALIWTYYSVRLWWGPGTKDGTGKRIPSSPEQVWLWALGLLLFFYNDPGMPSQLIAPTVAASGFRAFCTVTFLAVLLLYWLVSYDLLRLQGERGVGWQAKRGERLGALFWIPKVLLVAIIWGLALAAYTFQRLGQLQDASFTASDALGAEFVSWAATAIGGIGGLYVLLLAIYIVLGLRHFPRLRPSNKFLSSVTLTAILLILVTLFAGSYANVRPSAAAFLAAYGCPNVYIWTLLFLHLPASLPAYMAEDVAVEAEAEALAMQPVPALPSRADFELMPVGQAYGLLRNLHKRAVMAHALATGAKEDLQAAADAAAAASDSAEVAVGSDAADEGRGAAAGASASALAVGAVALSIAEAEPSGTGHHHDHAAAHAADESHEEHWREASGGAAAVPVPAPAAPAPEDFSFPTEADPTPAAGGARGGDADLL